MTATTTPLTPSAPPPGAPTPDAPTPVPGPPDRRRWSDPVLDLAVFVGRSARHSIRSVDAMVTSVALPVTILLLFVYVFGGALQPEGDYVDYVVPGLILLCAGFGAATTATKVNDDMTTGVIDRFRSMPVTGTAVLAGHVVASVVRNLASTAIVLGVALAIGFRPVGDPAAWLGVIGLLALYMTAVAWLAASFGLVARSAEGAGAFSFFIMFLPYLSSAFVPTDSMPGGLQPVADHQPVTPVVEAARALMMDTAVGDDAVVAVLWCVGGIVVGVWLSAVLFSRRTAS